MDSYEQQAIKEGYRYIAGTDEAGRGPLAGPVVAAAVIFKFPPPLHLGIRDSKTLSPSQRDNILLNIYREAVSVGVGVVWMDEIETTNIHAASLKAMADAVNKLNPSPDFLLIDGKFPIPFKYPVYRHNGAGITGQVSTSIRQQPVVKGDSKSVSIAAASIVAKTVRDSIMGAYHVMFPNYNFIMGAYHVMFPNYNFIKHKGYATPEHLEAIKCFGPSPIHRKTFKGVKEYLHGIRKQ
ncbi:MAG: ribonuclease HII [Deltaproteobacteria bacterium]|nr:ribonuclease HII [Deltaproteobacteria bacterium]